MSEGTAVIYQVGDRVKFELGDCIDYGTVVEVDNSVCTTDGNVRVLWDSTNIEQYSKPKYITLIERKQVSEPKTKHSPHKYADVIKCWADGGEIQFKYEDIQWSDYCDKNNIPNVDSSYIIWRIKPETKIISYRVGITKDNQVKVYHEPPTLDESYGSDAFKEWLDPEWRTIEVEK